MNVFNRFSQLFSFQIFNQFYASTEKCVVELFDNFARIFMN